MALHLFSQSPCETPGPIPFQDHGKWGYLSGKGIVIAGLLQRCSVVAASRRYVGKETDRRWEQGEDLSLVEFKTVEYEGSKQVVAGDEIKQQILKTGIRKLERETRVSHHTIARILKGDNVRRKTLAKIVKQVPQS